MNSSKHTLTQFDDELEAVREQVMLMGGLVENQIRLSMEALAENDVAMMEHVIANDRLVNGMEVAIDEKCVQIIARRQPAANDLRLVMTIIKTITDIERIGDEAAKIAHMARAIYDSDRPTVPRVTEISHVADIALGMLRNALDAFARLDLAVAAKVVRQDEQVDQAFASILRQLITFMMEDPRTISHAIEILFIAKAIERIGDHAKNIAEYVIYTVKGKDVRHITPDEIEQQVRGS